MKLCFTLDDVLRDMSGQFAKAYKRYVKPDLDLEAIDFHTNDYCTLFGFESKKAFQKFLYEEYPFEIFGEANACKKMLDKKLNLWLIDKENTYTPDEFDVSLANPFEYNASIGYGYFFISKMATRIRNCFFPKNSSEIWEKCDVLVTAEPKLLENKPEGKTAIKIEMPYNKECPCDYSYDGLDKFLEDEEIINKLMENNV